MVGIIDYNAGNIKSVEHALAYLRYEYTLSQNPCALAQADKVIFPGVGDARYAMEQLRKTGYDSFLKDCAASRTPILGVCLGAQIIFEHSEEGDTPCLGLIAGTVRHLSAVQGAASKLKVPHMGWNDVYETGISFPLFRGIPSHTAFYFVHSYVICPKEPHVVSVVCDYGIQVPAAIQAGNIFALQFHPEKSGQSGLAVLKNFIDLPTEKGASC
jgi:glutamine amidotransferase